MNLKVAFPHKNNLPQGAQEKLIGKEIDGKLCLDRGNVTEIKFGEIYLS
jgi:hypothetical protein